MVETGVLVEIACAQDLIENADDDRRRDREYDVEPGQRPALKGSLLAVTSAEAVLVCWIPFLTCPENDEMHE